MAKSETNIQTGPYNPMKDMVPVTLPRATGKEEKSVFVGFNGKGYIIERGVTVKVPRPVYNTLRNSEMMRERQARYEEAKQQEMREKGRELGLF